MGDGSGGDGGTGPLDGREQGTVLKGKGSSGNDGGAKTKPAVAKLRAAAGGLGGLVSGGLQTSKQNRKQTAAASVTSPKAAAAAAAAILAPRPEVKRRGGFISTSMGGDDKQRKAAASSSLASSDSGGGNGEKASVEVPPPAAPKSTAKDDDDAAARRKKEEGEADEATATKVEIESKLTCITQVVDALVFDPNVAEHAGDGAAMRAEERFGDAANSDAGGSSDGNDGGNDDDGDDDEAAVDDGAVVIVEEERQQASSPSTPECEVSEQVSGIVREMTPGCFLRVLINLLISLRKLTILLPRINTKQSLMMVVMGMMKQRNPLYL